MPIKPGRFSRMQTVGGLAARLAGSAVSSFGDRLISGRDAALEKLHRQSAAQLLETFGNMKGLPMKLGQILSFMDGAVPPEYQDIYRDALAKLQVRSTPYTWEQIRNVFESELGDEPEKIFAEFDRESIASASIGQVYRARLHDGREVAVKIQYPEIADAVKSDLRNLETMMKALRRLIPSLDNVQTMNDIVARFGEEIDYEREARNQKLFREKWADDSRVIIPKPVDEYCRSRVLVTELHSGRSFSEVQRDCSREEKSAYGEILFWFTYHSILTHGLFNADPHPGNYLFQEDGKIVFLDFGAVQHYSRDSVEAFRTLLEATLEGARGEDLWQVCEKNLFIPPGTSQVAKDALLEHFLFAMTPILSPQPYRYTTAFTSEVSALTTRTHVELAKQIFKAKLREAKREGLAPLGRILFGLNSLLAALEAERDWRTLIKKA